MLQRLLKIPDKSFFLFGPRGVGKTTWLNVNLNNAKRYNLLRQAEILSLTQDPDLFRKEIISLPSESWIIVDEVQKCPQLLDEIHNIMSSYSEKKYKFAITGSSARKLKRAGVNMLAGRAVNKKLFGFCSAELKEQFNINAILKYGTLPLSALAVSDSDRIDYLESYVETYIKEEIKEEALIRRLAPFVRFLKTSAIMSGQQTNLSSLARDTGVSRSAIEGYFDVLADTLLGFWLTSWQPRAKIKEVAHPKFYFFDTGLVRTLAGKLRHNEIGDEEKGVLFETFIINEVKTFDSYLNKGCAIHYWRTASGSEIDLVCVNPNDDKNPIGIEIKSSSKWRPEYSKVLKERIYDNTINKAFGIYLGENILKDDVVDIYPAEVFLQKLWNKEIL